MLSDTAEIVGELPQPPVILPAERGQLHILVAQLPLPRGGVFRGRVFRRRDGDGTALPADALNMPSSAFTLEVAGFFGTVKNN